MLTGIQKGKDRGSRSTARILEAILLLLSGSWPGWFR